MEFSYCCQHISANCNPMPNTLVFLDNDTIAYCFRDQVGLYNVKQNRVTQNLNYREVSINRANCINSINDRTIVVGYDSGHLIVYIKNNQIWQTAQIVKQKSAITLIHYSQDTLITNNVQAQIYFYTIQIQQGHKLKFTLKQFDQLKFPLNKILQSVVQFQYDGVNIVFMGGIDQKVYCYTRNKLQPLNYRFFLTGHQNGITKLTVTNFGNDFLLASSSKDGYIRLWRFTQNQQLLKFHKNVKKFDKIYCFLQAVLISHESSVTNLVWSKFNNKLQLVSCSLDCTICVWGCQNQESAWTVDTRMGQFLGNKNAYFNVVCNPKYQYLVSVNYIGSALIWNFNAQTQKFSLRPSFNGHTNQVRDIDWDHTGNFLVSVSKDQTTRVISRNYRSNLFHQISRAQVHGYDINAVSVIEANNNIVDLIACGADQKVIRIIQPPACFANYLNYFTKANLHLYFPNQQQQKKYIISKPGSQILQYQTYAEGGTQVLGLMTKAQRVQRQKISSYYDDEQEEPQQQQEKTEEIKQAKINFSLPPHDDYLIKHTLWPQMNKLYGHPHQICALAKNNQRKLLASSCSGKNKIFCTIIIWSTQSWKIKQMIQHHNYTVYGMKFSECGSYFASVSKDRKLALFDQNFSVLFSYEAHTRAITCVDICPQNKLIVTGSRDKTIKIHSIGERKIICEYQIKKQVDAIAFCTQKVIAVGCIDGTIIFLSCKQGQVKQLQKISDKYGHTKAITKLRYKNGLLGSCSEDHSTRIYKINIK